MDNPKKQMKTQCITSKSFLNKYYFLIYLKSLYKFKIKNDRKITTADLIRLKS